MDHNEKNRKYTASVAALILTALMLAMTACGIGDNSSEPVLDDTSNQVLPGEDWKGEYMAEGSTYVDADELSDTDKFFVDDTVFILTIDVSGVASLTMDPNLANKYARKADDYTSLTTFDLKWTEDGDSLVFHGPDTNLKQMTCTRVEDSDRLRLDMQYEQATETLYLDPVEKNRT